jgi:hypothetical protein
MIALLLAGLTITSEPPRVQLGETAKARLLLEAPSAPRLSASTGRIEGLRAGGEGRWEADYLPPDESVPQLALISAVAGGEVALFALPLWGQGDAVVKTRPRARFEVRIGEQRYPAVADEKGNAMVPVNVPPGVTAAQHGLQSIDLHVPPMRLVHAALDREKATADRQESVQVLLFAVAADGSPRSDARFSLRASRGEISAPRARQPGVYEAAWTFAPGPPGRALLSAALSDAPGLAAQVALELEAGRVASLQLRADRERLVAGEGGFGVRAIALDARGNPSAEQLQLETTLGEVRGTGADARVEVPASFGGSTELRVRAHPAGRPEPSAELVLPLVPGAPEQAEIEVPRRLLHADGVTGYPVRVRIADRFGNPVADARPEVLADPGSVTVAENPDQGAYLATILPPRSSERTFSTIAVRAGAAQARARLELLPGLHLLALSPRLGLLTNFSGFTSPVAAFEASLRTNRWGPELAFSADISFAVQNAGGSSPQGVVARTHTDWIAASLGVAWRLPVAPATRAWVGAGPQLTTVLTRIELAGLPPQSGVAVVPGAYLAAGAERRFRSLLPFVELRGSISADPALPTLHGALRALALTAGCRFELL